MKNNNHLLKLQTEIENKYEKRDKRKKRVMKVSGAGVKQLREILQKQKVN